MKEECQVFAEVALTAEEFERHVKDQVILEETC